MRLYSPKSSAKLSFAHLHIIVLPSWRRAGLAIRTRSSSKSKKSSSTYGDRSPKSREALAPKHYVSPKPSTPACLIIREGSQNKSIAKRKQKVNPRMSDQSDQPNALTSDEVNYLGLILEIAESRNWQALVFAMTSHTRLFESFARSLARTDELNGMTM